MTLKVVGAMWYWTYQYPSAVNFSFDAGTFDSYLVDNLMVQSKSTFKEHVFYFYRNLAVDELLTLPTFKKIRLLITSQDTIHC